MSMDIVDLEGAARRLGAGGGTADSELGRPTVPVPTRLGDLIEHLGRVAQAFGGRGEGARADQRPDAGRRRVAAGRRVAGHDSADLVTMARAWRGTA
jgi:hypothetical protein